MLLDIGSVFGGIGLAVVGFIVVILVCVVILRLLAAILPSYEDRTLPEGADGAADPGADADPTAAGVSSSPGEELAAAQEADQPD